MKFDSIEDFRTFWTVHRQLLEAVPKEMQTAGISDFSGSTPYKTISQQPFISEVATDAVLSDILKEYVSLIDGTELGTMVNGSGYPLLAEEIVVFWITGSFYDSNGYCSATLYHAEQIVNSINDNYPKQYYEILNDDWILQWEWRE